MREEGSGEGRAWASFLEERLERPSSIFFPLAMHLGGGSQAKEAHTEEGVCWVLGWGKGACVSLLLSLSASTLGFCGVKRKKRMTKKFLWKFGGDGEGGAKGEGGDFLSDLS